MALAQMQVVHLVVRSTSPQASCEVMKLARCMLTISSVQELQKTSANQVHLHALLSHPFAL